MAEKSGGGESTFSLATWNVLATAYIKPSFYPNTPPPVLDPVWRIPAVVQYAGCLDVDILCLQEVEPFVFDALQAELSKRGYEGSYARKHGHKPDGCAAFLRTDACKLLSATTLVYADGLNGSVSSGHIAQILMLDISGTIVALANTHFKWDPPQMPSGQKVGLRQAQLALEALNREQSSSSIQLLCGDFNATSDSELVGRLIHAGFEYTYSYSSSVFSCNSNGAPKLIDYVFLRGPARLEPQPMMSIDERTALPSFEQPSDHLPVVARIYLSC